LEDLTQAIVERKAILKAWLDGALDGLGHPTWWM
jgi:hypothetical protein